MYIKIGNVQAGGPDSPLIIESFEAPSTELRTNYVDRPNGDGKFVGRDWLGSTTWGFDFATNKSNLREALTEANRLERVWKDSKSRLASGVAIPLSYSLDGSNWFRVYGRCGQFTGTNANVHARLGVAKVTADFEQTRIEHFSDSEKLETITYVAPVQGGLTAPLIAPLTTVGTGAERAGFVTNTGDLPTPLKIRFYGPIQNPVLRSAAGWEVGLRTSIGAGDWIEIDPLNTTVKKRNGSSVAGLLTTRTRLSTVNLPVGKSELFLSGVDLSNSSKVEVRWRDAFTGLQF